MRSMSGIGIFSPPLMITRTEDRSRCSMSGQRHDRVDHRRRQPHRGHPRALDLVDHGGGVERPVDDRRAAGGDQRRGREVERADVVERTAREAEVVAREAELDDVGEVLPRQVGVGEHHALGAPGGARRVHQAVHVVGGCRELAGLGRDRAELGEGRPPVGAAGRDAGLQQSGCRCPSAASSAEVEQRLVAHEGRAPASARGCSAPRARPAAS